jgi:hypothetical protein
MIDESAARAEPREPQWNAADPILGMVVSEMNSRTEREEDGLRLMLMVNGQLVSGILIPAWQWFEEIHGMTSEAAEESLMSNFANEFKEAAARIKEFMTRGRESLSHEEEAEVQATSMHLHLKNATVFLPTPFPTSGGTYWRVRLSQVSAWVTGEVRLD